MHDEQAGPRYGHRDRREAPQRVEYRFDGDEVLIKRVGDAVVLLPRTRSWNTLFQSLEQFEPGFKLERRQPKAQQKRARLK